MGIDVWNLVNALPEPRVLRSVIVGDNDDSNSPSAFGIKYPDSRNDNFGGPQVIQMNRSDRRELGNSRLGWLRGDWY